MWSPGTTNGAAFSQCFQLTAAQDGAEMLPTSAAACHLCQIDLEPPKEPVDEWHKVTQMLLWFAYFAHAALHTLLRQHEGE